MQVRDRFDEFAALDSDIVVITFANPEALDDYRRYLRLPYAVASDRERSSYRAYGVTSGSLWKVWGPPVIWAYIKLVTAGRKLVKPRRGDDLSQLGADFVIDERGRLAYIHKSTSPVDRPSVDALLAVLRGLPAMSPPNSIVAEASSAKPPLSSIAPQGAQPQDPTVPESRSAARPGIPTPDGPPDPAPPPTLRIEPRAWHLPDNVGKRDALKNGIAEGKHPGSRIDPGPDDAQGLLTKEPFLEKVFSDLAQGGYGAKAWGRFCAAVWHRATTRALGDRKRLASFLRWALLGAVLGVGTCSLAWRAGLHNPKFPAAWTLWYLLVSFWSLLHLSRVRRPDGSPYRRFLWPNGLSFLRLALAPLAIWPILVLPLSPGRDASFLQVPLRLLFAGLLLFLLATDLLDGMTARLLDQRSLLGRVLDPLADLVFLSAIGLALYRLDILSGLLLGALVARYPGSLLVAVILYFVRGPALITATALGKLTTAMTAVFLALATMAVLLRPDWILLARSVSLQTGLAIFILANAGAMVWRGMSWPKISGRTGHE